LSELISSKPTAFLNYGNEIRRTGLSLEFRRKVKPNLQKVLNTGLKNGKSRKRKDNREFRYEWPGVFAFTANSKELPLCLISRDELSNNTKSNLENRGQSRKNR